MRKVSWVLRERIEKAERDTWKETWVQRLERKRKDLTERKIRELRKLKRKV